MSRKFRQDKPSCQNLEITGVLKTKDDEVESEDEEVLENQSHIPFSDAIKNPSNNFLMLNKVSHMLLIVLFFNLQFYVPIKEVEP